MMVECDICKCVIEDVEGAVQVVDYINRHKEDGYVYLCEECSEKHIHGKIRGESMLSNETRKELKLLRGKLDVHLQTIYTPSNMGSDKWNNDPRIKVLDACNTILATTNKYLSEYTNNLD